MLDDAQLVLGESDRYEIQQPLGKKAGRQTWLAWDRHTQERVVIKLLSFSHDFEWDDLKLFEREAATLQSLDHPAIPRYLDFFEFDQGDRKGFALVQTYIEANSLEQHLKSGRSFTEAEVEQLARELLEILRYLHDRQPPVIHRDIKPSNVLLTNRSGNSPGQVHLVDFGSVQTLAAKEGGTITVVGTYGYMPPEQFGGRATSASDLYSLGATLIYLTTGQHPADLPQEDLRIQFEHRVNLSPSFTHWLKWLTEPSLNKRPTSVQQAIQGLDDRQIQEAHSTVIEKPVDRPTYSTIVLVKKAATLEVLLPSQRLMLERSSLLVMPLLALILCLIPTPLICLIFWGSAGLLLSGSVLFIVSVAAMITRLLILLAGRTTLTIDPLNVVLIRKLFRFKYGQPFWARRRYIWKLVLVDRGYRLHLWVGTQKCEFVGTLEEMSWLAYELSDWLRLPIERE
ncbi:serine/threonine protein kinase [Phormidesmis priestleyi]